MTYRNRIIGHGSEDPEQLAANPRNWRIHPKGQEDALAGVLSEVGWVDTVLVNQRTGFVVDGHLRVAHAISKSEASVPVTYVDLSEEEEGIVLATLDPISALASTDYEQLDSLIADLQDEHKHLVQFLANLNGEAVAPDPELAARPSLSEQFGVPPFSVLDARQGYWQERKRQWLAIGIQSELGRGDQPGSSARAAPGEEPTYRQIGSGDGLLGFSEQARSHYKANATPGGTAMPAASLGPDGKTVRGDGREPGRVYGQDTHLKRPQARLTWVTGDRDEDDLDDTSRKILAVCQSGTSIFDPVLCELAYRWFCPPGGHVIDPLAGGSVRGIVASLLGRAYTGIELRPEQVAANEAQRGLCGAHVAPTWIVGDSVNAASLAPGEYDLLFTCPPYGDLERYSDDPLDLSTMEYPEFLVAYRAIIAASVSMLRDDRFACVVVGDIRDKDGMYRGLIGDTIAAFAAAGMSLYNEAILVTAVGSLPIRVGRQFSTGRKLGKTHQNVLVFVKGDPRKATEACGPVEVALPFTEDESMDG